MKPLITFLLVHLAGCSYVGHQTWDEDIRDYDGDGVPGVRFGGDDCRDDDPTILHCDADLDGHRSVAAGGDDCDDEDATVFPGSEERCNGVDDDCDGQTDDEDDDLVGASTWYADADGDGFGDSAASVVRCAPPAGWVADDRDCDDNRDDIRPGQPEYCDEIDRNCDGDPWASAVDMVVLYTDGDGDGWGASDDGDRGCEPEDGTSILDGDCDDADPEVHPEAEERWYDGVDQDCDGADDYDADGDGFVFEDDCDDADPDVNPDAPEVCDGVDNDCNGVVDSADPGAVLDGMWTYYLDADGDAYGDPDSASPWCPGDAPSGWVLVAGDCDDERANASPVGVEVCDGIDNDCNSAVDDSALGRTTYFQDSDGDGYGSAPIEACAPTDELVTLDGDCNDADATVHPGAVEICGDTVRQDCSTASVDDCDADGFDAVSAGGTDCDDEDPAVSPAATEVCDGLDNDCDSLFDDDDDSVDLSTITDWYEDGDSDGYGSTRLVLAEACAPLPGSASNTDDCDDADPWVHPDADEVCNGVDDDCDGDVDEGATDPPTWYADSDGDGYGDTLDSVLDGCAAPATGAWSTTDGDCDDGDPTRHPDADEVCDGVDNDCDGDVDDDDASVEGVPWYRDDDDDGWGVSTAVVLSCAQPVGYVAAGGDCDDADDTRSPGADEVCDGGVDNDCDGLGDDADPDLAAGNTWYLDGDGDGYGDASASVVRCAQPTGFVSLSTDCDDASPRISPAAAEVCDGVDNDCDGLVDDDDADTVNQRLWFEDLDEDGWGSSTAWVESCEPVAGHQIQWGDCDDSAGGVHPGADEVCNGVDDDCDGLADTADPGVVGDTWFADADGDGYGDPGTTTTSCGLPTAAGVWVLDDSDCNDAFANVHPGGVEVCDDLDNDCDGAIDDADSDVGGLLTWYLDADHDGFGDEDSTTSACEQPIGYVADDTDCDDTDSAVRPGSVELCNGVDDDCDALTDAADPSVLGALTWYHDGDGDGYGDSSAPVLACDQPEDYAADAGDCDDGDGSVHPGATETCVTGDLDCDGLFGDAEPDVTGKTTFHLDADGDGYGRAGVTTEACAVPGAGWVADASDCDDLRPEVHPGAPEVCDAADNDCDGFVDDADPGVLGALTWYHDGDADGFGDDTSTALACDPPVGYAPDGGDCDDSDALVHPGATETCATGDLDCDGLFGDDDPDVVGSAWYADVDTDGWGDATAVTWSCAAPAGHVALAGDCDDRRPVVNPTAPELCDGFDNDCDGAVDDDDDDRVGGDLVYRDADGDGWGDWGTLSCNVQSGFSSKSGDCDDTDSTVHPGAPEVCSGKDDDCDGQVDEDDPGLSGGTTLYRDADGDGYGFDLEAVSDCDGYRDGWNTALGDCDDTDRDVNPGAAEVCDGFDNDCDGLVDAADGNLVGTQWFQDGDYDGWGTDGVTLAQCAQPGGYVTAGGDCDDADASVNPGATEVCNGVDDDCDGVYDDADADVSADWWYEDADGDGFGDEAHGLQGCTPPAGYVADSTDCDDSDASYYPGQTVLVGTLSHPEIQPVVDAVCDDAVIEILSGTYPEQVVIPALSSITLRGYDATDPPVLSPPGFPAITHVAGLASLRLEDLEVRSSGVAIDLHAGVAATLVDVQVTGAGSGPGGGLSVAVASLDGFDCTFDGSTTSGDGGGLWADQAEVLLVDPVFSDNVATRGGGLYALDSTIDLYGPQFTGNSGTEGGAIYASGGSLVIRDLYADANDASTHGFASLLNVDLQLERGTIKDSGELYIQGTTTVPADLRQVDILASTGTGLTLSGGGLSATVHNVAVLGASSSGVAVDSASVDLGWVTLVGAGLDLTGASGTAAYLVMEGSTPNITDGGGNSLTVTTSVFTDGNGIMWDSSNDDSASALLYTWHPNLDVMAWDVHLRDTSPGVDFGPGYLDTDNGPTDCGRYGGPDGDAAWYDDNDGDFVPDGWELQYFGDLDQTPAMDFDSDTLTNGAEHTSGTDPSRADTDGDLTRDDTDTAPLDPTVAL